MSRIRGQENGSHVTLRELNDKLNGLRWEMRFLVVAAISGSKFIPGVDHAAGWMFALLPK